MRAMNAPLRRLLPLLLLSGAVPARADVVALTNGASLEGVLTRTADGESLLQVATDGWVILDTATVTGVTAQTPAQNAALKAKWAEDDAREAARERERRRYAESQRAKGLILYGDEWVTRGEFDRRLALEELALKRRREAPRAVREVRAAVEEPPEDGLFTYTTLAPNARLRRRRSRGSAAAPLAEFGASGNFIRSSEFLRPGAHGSAHYYDPSTGLYR